MRPARRSAKGARLPREARDARLSREDWLALGLDQLARRGPEALRLEALCAAAKKTRGSFYHHFADIDAFIAALTAYWVKRIARDIAAAPARAALNAAADRTAENAMRNFAAGNTVARKAVKEVDRIRLDYLTRLNRKEYGLSARKAEILALIEYAYAVGFEALGLIETRWLAEDADACLSAMRRAVAKAE